MTRAALTLRHLKTAGLSAVFAASMLVALPSSLAFGVVIYASLGPEYAGIGALAGILGAIVLGITAPLVGRTGGLISAPCAPSAAVLSALVTGLVAGNFGRPMSPQARVSVPTVALPRAVGSQRSHWTPVPRASTPGGCETHLSSPSRATAAGD